MFGQRDYSMRIWLDPDKLAVRNMTAGDVVAALREQNLQVAAGQIGQSPTVQGQQTQVTLTHAGPPGRARAIRQDHRQDDARRPDRPDPGRRPRRAGRQEPGHRAARSTASPVANLAIFQLPDANALETADIVKAKIEELKKDFPEGVDYMIRYDTTPFIRESIQEVFKTLLDSVILVALVVLVFLQNWRSAIIPLIAVPVGIVGTFAVMLAMGFSAEQPDALRPGAGDRHRGRRRDRGGRGGRAPHRARAEAPRRHDQGDERGLGAGDRGRAGALRGVHPVRVHLGDHRAVLPAVRPDDRLVDVISTFNSLTLSPALAAMLLEAEAQGGLRSPAVAGVRDRRGLGGLRVAVALPAGALTARRRRHGACASASCAASSWRRTPASPGARGPAGVDRRGGRGRPGGHVAG